MFYKKERRDAFFLVGFFLRFFFMLHLVENGVVKHWQSLIRHFTPKDKSKDLIRIWSVSSERLEWLSEHYVPMKEFYRWKLRNVQLFDDACEAFLLGWIDSKDILSYSRLLDSFESRYLSENVDDELPF